MADDAQGLGPAQLWLLKGLVDEGARPSAAEIAPKVSAFIDAYMETLNATEAAKRAGYSARSARQCGSRLMTNPAIRGELRRRLEDRLKAQQVTVDAILDLMRRRAHFDPRTLYRPDGSAKPVHDWPDDSAFNVAGIETEETYTLNGLELDAAVVEAIRQVLARFQLAFTEAAQLVVVRVVKIKCWDPNKSTEMLARYRKMLGAELPPPTVPMFALPESVARARLARVSEEAVVIDQAPALAPPTPTRVGGGDG